MCLCHGHAHLPMRATEPLLECLVTPAWFFSHLCVVKALVACWLGRRPLHQPAPTSQLGAEQAWMPVVLGGVDLILLSFQ